MHILFLTDNFPPEGNAPATRTYEHAREWVKMGHQVTVITGAPNFPEGKVFDGYENHWYHKSYLDGIEVRRVKTYITANEGFVKRILDFMSFMMTSFIAALFVKKADVIVATSPQMFTAVSGWMASVFKNKPFVFELRDIWPASITAVGAMKKSLAIRVLEKLEMFLYRRADKIISVTHSFKSELIARGIDGQKIAVVLNGVDLSAYKPVDEKESDWAHRYDLDNKFVVGYVGTHGMAHALEYVVEAAENLKHDPEIRILFAGGGAAKASIEKLIEDKGLKNVVSISRQPKEEMPKLWSLCDVSLISLKDTQLFETVIPSKIFESMGMGLPMIMTAPSGEGTSIILEADAGVVTNPQDAQQLSDAILSLKKNSELMSKYRLNSAKAASLFSREKLAMQFIEELEALM